MIYPCAISLCSVDLTTAELVHDSLREKGIGTFYYRSTPLTDGFMLNQHADIYATATVRIYLLRERSFFSKYPAFELYCGRGKSNNIVVTLEQGTPYKVPNSYNFIFDDGWNWLSTDHGIDLAHVTDFVRCCLSTSRL